MMRRLCFSLDQRILTANLVKDRGSSHGPTHGLVLGCLKVPFAAVIFAFAFLPLPAHTRSGGPSSFLKGSESLYQLAISRSKKFCCVMVSRLASPRPFLLRWAQLNFSHPPPSGPLPSASDLSHPTLIPPPYGRSFEETRLALERLWQSRNSLPLTLFSPCFNDTGLLSSKRGLPPPLVSHRPLRKTQEF